MGETQWFVEPLTASTNEVIARISPHYSIEAVEVFDREEGRHLSWRVPYHFVSALNRNKQVMSLRYKVFRRKGIRGPVDLCNLEELARVSRQKKMLQRS